MLLTVFDLPAKLRLVASAVLLLFCFTALSSNAAQAAAGFDERAGACREHYPNRRAWFGDTHIHTALSLDAATQDTRNRPADAYRFALGERIEIQPYDEQGRGLRSLQLTRPLDFAMVTDHGELLGEVHICSTPGEDGYYSWTCMVYRHLPRLAFFIMNGRANLPEKGRWGFCGADGVLCRQAGKTGWQEIQRAAEDFQDHSEECAFTTFTAYEWTASRDGVNLHRNVIFRNASVPEFPIGYVDEWSPERLWKRLEKDCLQAGNGCDVLAIPHNSNLSAGQMFPSLEQPSQRDHAALSARFEPLLEIMQHKGSSECYFGPQDSSDELCAFELLPYVSFGEKFAMWGDKEPLSPSTGFARQALNQGLKSWRALGVNPFRYGFIASTDSHLGASGHIAESGYMGHGGAGKPTRDADLLAQPFLPDDIENNPGGLAVLWAEENSRDALFDAMRRREAYGTSGPRIQLRFFGGWDYPKNMCQSDGFAAEGYARGVPMGGNLSALPGAKSQPRFAVWAMRDPEANSADSGAALERIQIVKGWLDAQGRAHKKVLDVVGLEHTGDDDMEGCDYRGKGYEQLCQVWRDESFDPEQPAWYYARVLQTPTCRWSERMCRAQQIDCARPETIKDGFEPCCSELNRKVIRERAWSSPIWHLPQP